MKNKFQKLQQSHLLMVIAFGLAACGNPATKTSSQMTPTDSTKAAALPPPAAFEKTIDGKQTHLYILKNKNGLQAAVTNYGGHLVALLAPDKTGKLTDVIIGFDTIGGYKAPSYYGAIIGRYGNRIAKGQFVLDGNTYHFFLNNGPNTLHGGKKGFDDVVWDAKQVNDRTVELSYLSKDGEEGYPGNLNCKVTYELTDDNAVKISYEATTDKPTVVNLTNHAYYNLNGFGNGNILKHVMQLNAAHYTPIDSTFIPTGEIAPVAGTPFDFTKPAEIGSRIEDDNKQLKIAHGYDHNYVIDQHDVNKPIATITGDVSGIKMEIFTTEPGVQFYTSDRKSFCMETEHYPDSPNKPQFPSTVLRPSQVYKTETSYKFSVK